MDQLPADSKQRARFLAEAQAAREDMLKTGKGFDADQVHAYIRPRIAGNKAAGVLTAAIRRTTIRVSIV